MTSSEASKNQFPHDSQPDDDNLEIPFTKPSAWNDHVKYNSIENSTNSKRIEQYKHENLVNLCEWVVSEKIHGSNFSFITNGTEIKCARRMDILDDNESFFGFQAIKAKLHANIFKLWNVMKIKNLIRGEKVIVYGEIFGGLYRHPDVKPIKGASITQFGIEYCPQNEFLAFDVFDGTDILDFDVMTQVLEDAGLPFLKPMARGSFDEVFNYNPDFITTIPTLFGLPPLPNVKNSRAEGVIIRPVLHLRTQTGSRVILKIKTKDFVERVRMKKKEYIKETKEMPKKAFEIFYSHLETFINKNRLTSAISKEGALNDRNMKKMAELVYQDALEDLLKEDGWPEKYDELNEKTKGIIEKRAISASTKVIREYLNELEILKTSGLLEDLDLSD
ncbi:hypothetical protein G9A89_008754 [Geosiphon pyriformis]|nr:hypothetical protein G9A89_008754 [Geosiphon pyriformis]